MMKPTPTPPPTTATLPTRLCAFLAGALLVGLVACGAEADPPEVPPQGGSTGAGQQLDGPQPESQQATEGSSGSGVPAPGTAATTATTLGTEFTRVRPLEGEDAFFEVSILECRNGQGIRVDLVSAIHVADARHYAELNRRLQSDYDAVLYELVSDPDVRPHPGMERGYSGVGMIQKLLQNGLEMAYQVEEIDYRPEHFVHADLTPEGFDAEMERRGETFLSMMFQMMMEGQQAARERYDEMSEEEIAALPETDLVRAAQTGYLRHALRKLGAQVLGELETSMGGAGGGGTTLIEGRNARCIEVLEEQVAAGKERLAIYYGAGHMPDMLARLRGLGFEPVAEEWLVAWDIRKRKDGVAPEPFPGGNGPPEEDRAAAGEKER